MKPDDLMEEVRAAQAFAEEKFMGLDNVIAIAVGLRTIGDNRTDELCVKIFVKRKPLIFEATQDEVLPQSISVGGNRRIAVDVEEMDPPCSGDALPQVAPQYLNTPFPPLCQRVRPAMGGFSVAHCQFRFGTIATMARDKQRHGVYYILSNNHVLALTNDGRFGDPILQPGPVDGGRYPRDMIAQLCHFVPLRFDAGSSNLVDAAAACVAFGDVERRVYGIGYPQAIRQRNGVLLGEIVQKVGRSTGYTQGRIIGIHGTVKVNYSGERTGRFRDQIITTGLCDDGDSGSLILDLGGNAVGLLFGISSTHTIVNYIEDVQNQLGIVVAERMV